MINLFCPGCGLIFDLERDHVYGEHYFKCKYCIRSAVNSAGKILYYYKFLINLDCNLKLLNYSIFTKINEEDHLLNSSRLYSKYTEVRNLSKNIDVINLKEFYPIDLNNIFESANGLINKLLKLKAFL